MTIVAMYGTPLAPCNAWNFISSSTELWTETLWSSKWSASLLTDSRFFRISVLELHRLTAPWTMGTISWYQCVFAHEHRRSSWSMMVHGVNSCLRLFLRFSLCLQATTTRTTSHTSGWNNMWQGFSPQGELSEGATTWTSAKQSGYPLVNVYITMENHHF